MLLDKTVKFQDWTCAVEVKNYGGKYAIRLYDHITREPVATASVQVPNIPEGYVAIKDYSENTGMLETMVKNSIVGEPVMYVPSGFVEIPVCELLVKE